MSRDGPLSAEERHFLFKKARQSHSESLIRTVFGRMEIETHLAKYLIGVIGLITLITSFLPKIQACDGAIPFRIGTAVCVAGVAVLLYIDRHYDY